MVSPAASRPRHTAFMLLRDFLPADLFFKIAFWWAFISVLGLTGTDRALAIRAYAVPFVLSSIGFYLIVLRALWPLEIFRRGVETDAALRAAALAANRAPFRLAFAAALGFSFAFLGGVFNLVYGSGVDVPRGTLIAVVFFEITIVIGASTFGSLIITHTLARTTAGLSLRLLQRGIAMPLRATSLRRSNVIYGLGIGLTPVALLTGMMTVRTLRATRADGLLRAQQTATALALRLADGEALAVPPDAEAAMVVDRTGQITALAGRQVRPQFVGAALRKLAASDAQATAIDDGEQVLGVARGGGRIIAVALPDKTNAASVYWLSWIAGVFMVVFAGACAFFLSTSMLLVVRRVGRALREIGEAGHVEGAPRIPVLTRDELGELVESANAMIERLDGAEGRWRAAAESLRDANQKLEQRVEERTAALRDSNRELGENLKRLLEARSQLAEAARAAGMAEVASSVLHNVGNVLNSVNVSVGLAAQRLRASKAHDVKRAMTIVPESDEGAAAFFAGDPRGRALPRYLRRLGDALIAENGELLRELGFLEKNVEHIKVIVSLQQAHAKHGGLVEPLRVAELCDDAVRFGLGSLEPAGVKVQRELDRELEIVADRHRLFQIVVNLVRNARDAVREGVAAPRIHVAARRDGVDAIIEVSDNGCGITAENLTRIFNLGFTTKADGHGYGLHSSAVAAGELGGALGVRSEGSGMGATFALRLPCEPAERAA